MIDKFMTKYLHFVLRITYIITILFFIIFSFELYNKNFDIPDFDILQENKEDLIFMPIYGIFLLLYDIMYNKYNIFIKKKHKHIEDD